MITAVAFAAAMAALGPFEPQPSLAAGVSGGADSMALALLAQAWVRERDGNLLALIVDHGLRRESGREAADTAVRLGSRGIVSRVLTIGGLEHGPALAERAREARFRVLSEVCAAEGILHLLLGHHAGDQAETVLIRALGGSGPAGLAGMAPLVEQANLRILRPLLGHPPAELRQTLLSAGMVWAEDPSNANVAALRPRLRLLRGDRDGVGSATGSLYAASIVSARNRGEEDRAIAADLAAHASLRPEGFCLLSGSITARSLAALVQAIAGSPFPPPTASIVSLAASPRPATLSGVRLLNAGRLGPGLVLVREEAAMAPRVPARPGVIWDGRFHLGADARTPPGATIGALGADAARLRRRSSLPSAVLRSLPAVRQGDTLLAVPHLLYPDHDACACFPVTFNPPRPAAAAPFFAVVGSRPGLAAVPHAFGDA